MDYRLYQFGEGRFLMAGDLRCRSDDEATHVAEKLRCGRAMELWHGARLVAAWEDLRDPPATLPAE